MDITILLWIRKRAATVGCALRCAYILRFNRYVKQSDVSKRKVDHCVQNSESFAADGHGMITVRYLGPSNYGLVNYATSVIAFTIPVMQLGLNSTLVQEYVTHPEAEAEIAGTSVVLSIISGLACMVGVASFASVVNH